MTSHLPPADCQEVQQQHQSQPSDHLLLESPCSPPPIYLGMEWAGFSPYNADSASSLIVSGMSKPPEAEADNPLLDPELLQLKPPRS